MEYPEMKQFNIVEETKYFMDSNDFNNLVRKHLPLLIKDGAKYKNFEGIAEFEWNNYSNYDVKITKNDLKEDGFYNEFDKKDIINKANSLSFHGVMCFLVENKILPYGEYIIAVSW